MLQHLLIIGGNGFDYNATLITIKIYTAMPTIAHGSYIMKHGGLSALGSKEHN